jgi:hypothetical protein
LSPIIGNHAVRPLRSLVGKVRKLTKARMVRMARLARQAKDHYPEAPFALRRMVLTWSEASEDVKHTRVVNENLPVRSP